MSSLSEIQVNTDELRTNAGTLKKTETELANIVANLQQSLANIGDGKEYKDQLQSRIRGLVSKTANYSANLQTDIEKLVNELNARAWAFDSANIPRGQKFSTSLLSKGNFGNLVLLVLFSWLANLKIRTANLVLDVTGFNKGLVSNHITVLPSSGQSAKNSFSDLSLNKKYEKLDNISNEIKEINKSSNPDSEKLSELESQKNSLQQAINEEKPQAHDLVADVKPSDYPNSCALYAQHRRSDLGTTASHHVDNSYEIEAAANYKNISSAFELSSKSDTSDLRSLIAPGYAIVWDKDAGMDSTYGHVAIIEEVYKDHIVVSQANYSGGNEFTTSKISTEGIYIVP